MRRRVGAVVLATDFDDVLFGAKILLGKEFSNKSKLNTRLAQLFLLLEYHSFLVSSSSKMKTSTLKLMQTKKLDVLKAYGVGHAGRKR